ncbi:MAG: DNA repair protein RecO [Chloroflexi bacterium]|nr:MAG: DNA repair protein RecO [Chloroflexota bacterium]
MPSRIPRVIRTNAIVLRHRRLGEADRIVTLLTPLRGKIDVIAKGVLRSRSRMGGHLEPLTLVEVVLAHGRSMDVVTQAQTIDAFPAAHDDLDRLSAAMYLLELADRITVEHAEAEGLHDLLHVALVRLARGDGQQVVQRTFELALLEATGFRPELTDCLRCSTPVPAEEAWWAPVEGGVLCTSCARAYGEAQPIDATALRVLRAFQSQTYEEAGRIRLTDELAARMESAMHALMRSVVERDLKSAQFVSAARRARVAGEARADAAADGAPTESDTLDDLAE